LFVSDLLDSYGVGLLDRYHVSVFSPPTGKRGRPALSGKKPIPELRYSQGVKKKEGRRLVSISRKIVYGDSQSIPLQGINTRLIERLNLTLRRENANLQRKTLSFAKEETELKAHFGLQVAYYHLVRPHLSLRKDISAEPEKKRSCRWRKRTHNPAMAAKITDHVWSLSELLTFRPYITSTN
jgi:hypothetical protein